MAIKGKGFRSCTGVIAATDLGFDDFVANSGPDPTKSGFGRDEDVRIDYSWFILL